MTPCRQDNDKVQQNRRWQRPNNVSSSYPQEAVHLSPSTGVIDTRTPGKPKTFTGQPAEWTTWQFTFKAFACATHPRMRDVFELATRKGSDPVINSDMTVELQSLSTQSYCMLVMMLSDQALEIVRNSPEGVGAEVWRKLLWEYEPGVGIRYGAMLLSLLKRRFGEHDETDLAREIEPFERDISKYEQQDSEINGHPHRRRRETIDSGIHEHKAKLRVAQEQSVSVGAVESQRKVCNGLLGRSGRSKGADE